MRYDITELETFSPGVFFFGYPLPFRQTEKSTGFSFSVQLLAQSTIGSSNKKKKI